MVLGSESPITKKIIVIIPLEIPAPKLSALFNPQTNPTSVNKNVDKAVAPTELKVAPINSEFKLIKYLSIKKFPNKHNLLCFLLLYLLNHKDLSIKVRAFSNALK